jgi:hypothetical protein
MVRAPFAAHATSLAVVLATLASCGGSPLSPSQGDDAGVHAASEAGADEAGPPPTYFVEACTDGPRWPNGSQFSYERDGPTDAGPCTPHCGPNPKASALWGSMTMGLTTAALPSGACSHEGNTCTMAAEWLGPCPLGDSAEGPLDLFICRCTSGQWGCTIDATAPSATSQSCTPPADAGMDEGG